MNTDAMRKAFGLPYFNEDDLKKGARPPKSSDYYYNTVFSDKKLTFKHNMMIMVGIIMLSYVLTRAFFGEVSEKDKAYGDFEEQGIEDVTVNLRKFFVNNCIDISKQLWYHLQRKAMIQ